jgi:hypothetical protein
VKLTRLLIVAFTVAALFASASSAIAPQKSATAQATQAQLEERIKELEKRADAAEQKAASATMEKDYITRVQKQYESYYEKALSTQMWTLGIMGLILTAVFALAGRFSLTMFDTRTKSALAAAVATLEKDFSQKMQTELDTLRKANDDQLKALEHGIKQEMAKHVTNLEALSDFAFYFSQGLSFGLAKEEKNALIHFRAALKVISENREIFEHELASAVVFNLFKTFQKAPETFAEEAKKELADPLYKNFQNELNRAAIEIPELAPLVKEIVSR